MRRLSILALFLLLAACGRDGPPLRVATSPSPPAVSALSPALGPPVAFMVAVDEGAVGLWRATETWNGAIEANARADAAQRAARSSVRTPERPRGRSAPEPAEPDSASTGHTSASVAEAIAHWFPHNAASATRVANCESTLNPAAVRAGNLGLFQINTVHAASFAAVTGQPYRNGALNAWYNAQFAAWLYGNSGWGPWACRWAA